MVRDPLRHISQHVFSRDMPWFIKGSFSNLGLIGTIPKCLLQNLTNLQELHLSGKVIEG